MTDRTRTLPALALIAAALVLTPLTGVAQSNAGKSPDTVSKDRWLHVRVENPDTKDESVRVNIPLELAEKVLPTINHDRLQSGKVKVSEVDCHGVDLPALLDAVRTSKDGEFVTVQNKDSDVRVAKQNNYFLIHVVDKNRSGGKDHAAKKSTVEVKIPMRVVDALFSGRKDELDLVAGLRALSAQGDTELVSVRDDENTVRVWLDSKNASD
jgi:hypothetical protein